MSPESMYVLLLILTFFMGLTVGGVLVLWSFAKDKTIVRIAEDDVIVKRQELEQIKKRINHSFDND